MTSSWRCALIVLALAGCGRTGTLDSRDASSSGSGGDAGPSACVIPASAALDAGGGAGCSPIETAPSCEVSSGATVLGDGGVENGTESCQPLCGAAQYELQCNAGEPGPGVTVPEPATALGCRVLPLPTPAGVNVYCCPCG